MPKLCVALDLDREEAYRLIESLSGYPLVFKIGPKLFLEAGREVIEVVKGYGREVFLDMKFHDIPNTVKLAVEEAEKLGVDYLTLHTLGGREMLESAVSARRKTNLLGVTILTSQGEEYLDFIKTRFPSVKELALYLADIAKDVGLDGVVCSAQEVYEIKRRTGLLTVVPGIRVSGDYGDQKRVFTPNKAVSEGADIIVMGRDIYRSADPGKVVERVLESLGE
ncbi:orotidine-5'-phosphate decarboxylase [Hydrogenivirga caldilitoris]|uniref:Orotidine 5'-phosphate decarboxylase n=1 Tax=Hydrogenivirga caldilitoris TaxID=246264 RepID=A0A497XSF9_9AQUI|nr:orotidine-5'-phosphate decarboxylase [Hydrogenivirga caldilitoris]RLJ71234.1 orotidine-5'-phosphate decarboxylase [Hydrogenivirga caldilitoris]